MQFTSLHSIMLKDIWSRWKKGSFCIIYRVQCRTATCNSHSCMKRKGGRGQDVMLCSANIREIRVGWITPVEWNRERSTSTVSTDKLSKTGKSKQERPGEKERNWMLGAVNSFLHYIALHCRGGEDTRRVCGSQNAVLKPPFSVSRSHALSSSLPKFPSHYGASC